MDDRGGLSELMTWLHGVLDDEDRRARDAIAGRTHPLPDSSLPPAKFNVSVSPGWLLADAAAKRAILDLHSPADGMVGERYAQVCQVCGRSDIIYDALWDNEPYPCRTVRLLASAYADRTGYRPEWRIES